MASSRTGGATRQSDNKRVLLMMPPTQHQAVTQYTEPFEEWFAGFDIPDYGLRMFDDRPRSQMPVSWVSSGIPFLALFLTIVYLHRHLLAIIALAALNRALKH